MSKINQVTVGGTTYDLEDTSKVSDNPTFTEASTRANIESGETFSTILGKIKKFFSDLATVAFSGSYSDLSDTPTIPTNVSQLTNDSGFLTSPVAIANGGTGATTRLKATQNLFSNAVESPHYVCTCTNSWADSGISSMSQLKTQLGSMTPASHASTGTGYGAGTASYYGHVKLSDTYASNVGGASSAIGASQTALYNAYTNRASLGANSLSGSQTVSKIVGADTSAYINAQFVSQSLWSQNNSSRAGYGFHNNGKNGAFLYLETDGTLKLKTNSGTTYKINMTQI